MSELILWKQQEITRLREEMNQLFDECRSGLEKRLFAGERIGLPHIELYDTADTLTAHADLPHAEPGDLDITVTSDTLTIKVERKKNSVGGTGSYQRFEQRFDSLSRTLRLPCKVRASDSTATFRGGKLDVVMPKMTREQARRIEIRNE
jgi:HSP20 family protein